MRFVRTISFLLMSVLTAGNGFAAEQNAASSAGDSHLKSDVALPNVEIKGKKDGTAEAGYTVQNISTLGLAGPANLQNTPYSISVIPSEMIKNTQMSTTDDVIRMNPFMSMSQPEGYGSQSKMMIRGFAVDNFQALENGIQTSSAMIDLEDKERVEVLNGPCGFLYGMASPGGTVNYVSKTPTARRLTDLTVGSFGGTSRYIHADLGGPILGGRLGYRINIAARDGKTAVKHQSITRYMISGVIDWHATDSLLLTFDAAHHYSKTNGTQPSWTFSDVNHSEVPDTQELWGQKWGFSKERRDKAGVRMNWALSRIFTLRSGIGYQYLTREALQFKNTVSSSDGTYSSKMVNWAPWKYSTAAGFAALDSKFSTGIAQHKVTAGYFGRKQKLFEKESRVYSETLSGTFTFSDPEYVSKPEYTVGKGKDKKSSITANENFMIGDNIDLGRYFTFQLGVNYAKIVTRSYSLTTGAVSASYDKSKIVPSVSAVYKPLKSLSAYATYTQGVEKGGTASSTAENANEIMAPMLTKQYEVGTKASVGKAFLTLALFQIDKAYEYLDESDNYYKQNGREVHRGAEFGVSGRVLTGLTLWGGVTLMHARIDHDNSSSQLDGKKPVNVPEQMAKLYAEYDLPFVRGLTVTGGVYFTGEQAANTQNTENLAAYTTEDLGVRYRVNVLGNRPLTLRIGVTNLTNEKYWASSSYTGAPRTVRASAEVKI